MRRFETAYACLPCSARCTATSHGPFIALIPVYLSVPVAPGCNSGCRVCAQFQLIRLIIPVSVVLSLLCRPQRHPDLQTLKETAYWDCVFVTGIPDASRTAGAMSGQATMDVNGTGVSPTSSQESLVGPPSAASDTAAASVALTDIDAQSVLILGLRGQNHDLER